MVTQQTLIDVVLLIPVAVIAFTIGVGIALGSCISHDKRKANRVKRMVISSDSWCQHNCRYCDECYSKHKDPDNAWKELEDHCIDCPMAKAIDVWEEQEIIKERGKQR